MSTTKAKHIGSSPHYISPEAFSKRDDHTPSSHIKRSVSQEIESNSVRKTGKTKVTKAAKPRRRWKKPKGKPNRPLSAYNLYFKDERQKIIKGEVPTSATGGMVGLTKCIAGRWKALDSQTRAIYKARAEEEKKRYFFALVAWKQRKVQQEEGKVQREIIQEIPRFSLESEGHFVLPTRPMSCNGMLQQVMFCHPYQNNYNAFNAFNTFPSGQPNQDSLVGRMTLGPAYSVTETRTSNSNTIFMFYHPNQFKYNALNAFSAFKTFTNGHPI